MNNARNSNNTPRALSREIADLDAQMNAKLSFASRVGLLPFAVGAASALATLLVFKFVIHL
ncbi:hypothetical protein ABQX22_03865 [Xanthomonas sp. WHRI 1810A]|uniref:hypothetical protein n=1 Tax=Xanthomonas sp. WHRI 1810A TaxID=3161565 RepID=UPI0032E8C9BD